jgi:rod shape-determining protein MreD
MKESGLWIGFFLATLMASMQSALFPYVPLTAYTPFLALCCMYVPYHRALWLSALSGICLDLMSTEPFGLSAVTYTLLTALFYRIRSHTFKEFPLQLCFFTALFSAGFTPLLLLFLFLFDRRPPSTGHWFVLELMARPLIDAVYAFFWFVGPLLLLEWIKKSYLRWRLKYDV